MPDLLGSFTRVGPPSILVYYVPPLFQNTQRQPNLGTDSTARPIVAIDKIFSQQILPSTHPLPLSSLTTFYYTLHPSFRNAFYAVHGARRSLLPGLQRFHLFFFLSSFVSRLLLVRPPWKQKSSQRDNNRPVEQGRWPVHSPRLRPGRP